ncbi:MAG: hypothetical protein ACYTE3_30045, partial [Planctomycetota bacterium]
MASVFKRKRKVKLANGRTVVRQSAKWHIKYVDADGIERRVVAYKDKTASQQLAARLEKEAELAKEGVVDRHKEHRRKPLIEHLEDFQRALLAKGNTEKHARQVVSRSKRIVQGCKFVYWPDIQASKAQQFLADLQKSGRISVRTFNHYLKAVQEFANWMVQDDRANESPLKHLKCRTVQKVVDEEHPRRALEVDELRRLLEVTKSGPT